MSSYDDRAGIKPDASARIVPPPGSVDPARFERHSNRDAIRGDRRGFSLGPSCDQWNAWVRCREQPDAYGQPPYGRLVLQLLREWLPATMFREMKFFLNRDERDLWEAIYARTLAMGWLVEKITTDMFQYGHRNRSGKLICDKDEVPYLRGAVAQRRAIPHALVSLWRKRQIEVFEVKWKGNVQSLYMPCSVDTFALVGQTIGRRWPDAPIEGAQLAAEVRWIADAMWRKRVELHPEGQYVDDPAYEPLRLLQSEYDECKGWALPEVLPHHKASTRPPDTRRRFAPAAQAEDAEPVEDEAWAIAAE